MDEVRDKIARGTSPTCFAKHLLEEQHNLGMSDLEIAYTAGSPFGAGVETVHLLLQVFIIKKANSFSVRGITCKFPTRMCQIRTSVYPQGTRRTGPSRGT
jgi:hypothetical protein